MPPHRNKIRLLLALGFTLFVIGIFQLNLILPGQPLWFVLPGAALIASGMILARFARQPLVSTYAFILIILVSFLPVLALYHGLILFSTRPHTAEQTAGVFCAALALILGAVFFYFSCKYYLASLTVLLATLRDNKEDKKKTYERLPSPIDVASLPPNFRPFVSIHVASFNEKRVIERLLTALDELDYPHYEVIWADDSTDETSLIRERWAKKPKFKVLHRITRAGFKGGALQGALEMMDKKAEYVVVFDADSVPFPDTLQRFLPHFYTSLSPTSTPKRKSNVGAVQSYQWHVLNKSEGWLTEAVRAEYAGSYMIERPFQQITGALKMIAGTAYMIRADILKDIGWGRSLTEDWELTLKLYARGYKVVYTPYAETPAECVSTFARLARQRMRWAEGHSFNVRSNFFPIMSSPNLNLSEKFEFLYYSIYYLQAALFIVGCLSWGVAEFYFHAHIPGWTVLLGWSLLFSNFFSLPFMNFSGLILEQAPLKDFGGIMGAVATSYLLVPFQAYAAIRGLFEKDEQPWFRTPKTGRITDPVHHLSRLRKLRLWLLGNRGKRVTSIVKQNHIRPKSNPTSWAWITLIALILASTGLVATSFGAKRVAAAGTTTMYLHDIATGTWDPTAPVTTGAAKNFAMTTANSNFTWATPTPTLSAQTIFKASTFFMNYWSVGAGTSTVDLTFSYTSSPSCGQIVHWQANANVNTGTTISTVLPRNVVAGDLLVGAARGSGVLSMSDNVNGAWTKIAQSVGVGIFYFPNSKAAVAGGMTVTANSTATGTIRIAVDEFSNIVLVNPLDQFSTGTSTTVNWAATATAAIPAGELVYAAVGNPTNNITYTAGTTNGAPMIIGIQQTSATFGTIGSEYLFGSVAGAQNATMTLSATSGTSYDGDQGTFKQLTTSLTQIAKLTSVTLTSGSNLNAPNMSAAANTVIPAGSYLCWQVNVRSVTGGGLTMHLDDTTAPTKITSSQTIFVSEYLFPLSLLALVFPPALKRLRRYKEDLFKRWRNV